MKIIINNSSMTPIYEQIVEEVKKNILSKELKNDEILPSVRALSKELRVSALTVKKAYDTLEELGFTKTVHGKGTYVVGSTEGLLKEEKLKEIEELVSEAYRKAKLYGVSKIDFLEIISIITEE